MQTQIDIKQETPHPFFYMNLRKASPEAVAAFLDAMNAEVNEAVAENRIPTLERAHRRLYPSSASLQ